MRDSNKVRRGAAYATVAVLAFTTRIVVVHAEMIRPGHITGMMELQGLTWTNGTVSFDGPSPWGPDASALIIDNRYDAVVESGATYTQVFAQGDVAGAKAFWLTYPTIPVPLDGTVAWDQSRPVGTVHVVPAVTGGFGKAGGRFYSTFEGDALSEQLTFVIEDAPGPDAVLPAAAGNVVVGGRALVSVTDAGGAVLCEAAVAMPDRTVAVPAGGSVDISVPVAVGPEACVTGIAGRYEIALLPGRPAADAANLFVTGETAGSTFYSLTNPGEYSVTGIEPGNYELYPLLTWNTAPYGTLQPPRPRVDVVAGQTTLKDLVYPPAAVRGSLVVGGSGARLANSAVVELRGGADLDGAYASKSASGDGTYVADLVPGTWVPFTVSVAAQNWSPPIQYASSYLERLDPSTAFVATANTIVDGLQRSIDVTFSEVFVDFEEPAGVPEVLISNPWLLAFDDPYTVGKQINASGYRQELPVAPVRIVAAPGVYSFQLFAEIAGGRTTLFDGETLEIGRSVPTPGGADIGVDLVGALGEALGAAVRFGQVSVAGATSATVVDVGPAAPPGTMLLRAFGGRRYLYVDTSAQYDVGELAVSYDLAALGVAPGEGPALVLRQFACIDDDHCAWRDLPVRVDIAARKVYGAFRGSGAFCLVVPPAPQDRVGRRGCSSSGGGGGIAAALGALAALKRRRS